MKPIHHLSLATLSLVAAIAVPACHEHEDHASPAPSDESGDDDADGDCSDDQDCPGDEVCDNRVCQRIGCQSDADCKGERICVDESCQDPPNTDDSGADDTNSSDGIEPEELVDFCCASPHACELYQSAPDDEPCYCSAANGATIYGSTCSDDDVGLTCCTGAFTCQLTSYGTLGDICGCYDAYGYVYYGQTC